MDCPPAIATKVKKRMDGTGMENQKKEECRSVLWDFMFIW